MKHLAISGAEIRELELGELSMPSAVPGVQAVLRIKARHFALAKALAEGIEPAVAAAITGYAPGTVSQLCQDPTFQNLIASYRQDIEGEYVNVHQKLATLTVTAMDELQERIENNPEEVKTTVLTDIMTKGLDRIGHGPTSKTDVNVNVNLASRLEAARKRIKIIEGTVDG